MLQSIYLDELLVSRTEDGGWEVSLVLHPSTAEDSVSQFVRLTLTLTLDQQYPSSSPAISIHNPRGLSDDKLSSVQKCLQSEAQSCLGSPVLYQLIEKAKEILTESNIPHGNCVICLYGFKDGETFTKTSCYHYFHCHCLGRYVSHSESELRLREKELEEDKTRDRADLQELMVVCPVCREPLTYDIDQLLSSPAPQLPELDGAAIGSKFQQKWCELQKLLERQKAKGGIIDPEAESNRFLIHINETPAVTENGNLDVDVSPGSVAPSAADAPSDGPALRADRFAPGPSACKGGPGPRRQNQRRGGRSKPHHRRAAPVTEQLDKLSLSSAGTEGPIKARAQGNHGQRVQENPELCQTKTVREVDMEPRENLVPPDQQPVCQAGSETGGPGDLTSGRGYQGRRRGGPQRPVPHATHHYGDWRAPRSRGGGARRGHSRGFQHRVVEREEGREEVL